MLTKKDVIFCRSYGDFRTNNLEKQSKNWKLQDTGRKGDTMFVLVFYISERFRIRPWVGCAPKSGILCYWKCLKFG